MARIRLVIAVVAALSVAPMGAQAQVTPTGQTSVTNAPNGTPVVNIATPNGAGLSRNTYTDYNVGAGGLVLNNGAADALSHASQLAGQVLSNPNLSTSAKVILNEVTSTNRSVLAGYTEVVGGAADVVVSNPYGVTCNGCGFINTPNVTLTTGSAQFNGSGALTGFAVNGGDILITGTGLNASAQDYLAIVSRQIKVDGQVNGKSVDLVGGAGTWDYVNRSQTAATGATPAPQYVIDSTALGGIYAGKIRLISNEAGVGVRMLGDAAASGSDFSIDAAGAVVLNNKITAAQDVRIASTSAGADAVTIAGGAQVTAQRNLAVTSAGATTIDNATLNAGGAFTVNAGSYATGASGATLASSSAMALTTSGALALGTASVSAASDLALTSTAGQVTIASGSAQGVQSTNGAITVTGATGFDNAGVLTANAGSVTLRVNGLINNTGTLHAATPLSFADQAGGSSETVTNAGKVISDGSLAIAGQSMTNTGVIQSANTGAVLGATLTNSGTITLGTNAAASSIELSNGLTNTGRVQAAGSLTGTVSGAVVNAGGTILAGSSLTLQARDDGNVMSIVNNANGVIQAGTLLSVLGHNGAGNATLTNSGAQVLGATINMDVLNLSNIQSGQIQASGDLTALFRTSATNEATISAASNMMLTTGSTFSNSATGLVSGLNVTMRGISGPYSVTNSGRIQATKVFDIARSAGGLTLLDQASGVITADTAKVDANILTITTGAQLASQTATTIQSTAVTLGANAKIASAGSAVINTTFLDVAGTAAISTGALNVAASTVTLADGAGVTAQADLILNASTVTTGGSNTAIIGGVGTTGGLTQLTIANPFTNNGLIYSGGNLILTTPSFINGATGGAGSRNAFTLTTTGAIDNFGALYAGKTLTATAGTTFTNEDAGTVNSDQDATITADTFVNHNNVNVTRDLTITANTFQNDVIGGDDRYWTYAGTGFNPLSGSSCTAAGGPCGSTNGTENYSLHLSQSYVGNLGGHYDNFSADFQVEQKYASGAAPTHKPQIRANNSLTIKDFTTGTNIGGVLSAPTITISSTKPGASFNNDDMSLTTQYWHDTYSRYIDCYISFPGIDCDTGALGGYNKYITNATYVGFGAGVFAGTLNISGVALTNTGSQADQAVARLYSNAFPVPTTTAGGALTATTSGVSGSASAPNGATPNATTAAARAAFTGAITFGGLNLNLPSNPNGIFITTKDPSSAYLVESNPHFTDGTAIGSDYLASHLGISPDTIQRRLGDASYETYLIGQQILAATGNLVIARADTEQQQVQSLMDNALQVASTAGLQFGVAPTAAQLAQIDTDFVWMVPVVVDGQTVLAPQVFLSAKTKSQVETGAVIAANDLNADVTSLTNSGGTIVGSNTLNVTSTGDVTNTSGTIKGGDVTIASTGGSIINQDLSATGVNAVQGTAKVASIQSTGTLSLDAANDITVKGAQVNAGGDATLKAGGNVTFDTTTNHVTTVNGQTTTDDVKNLTSGLTSGGTLTIAAANDITLAGTNVKAQDASLDAGGNINVLTRQDTHQDVTRSNSSNGFSSSTSTVTNTSSTAVGSTLDIGGNLKTNSGGDTTIQGSQVNVAGNADIKTGGDLNIIAGQNTSEHTEETKSSGVGHNGNLYGSTDHTVDDTHTRSVASGLNIGGNLNADVGKTMTIQGSNVNTTGDTTISATDVQVLAGVNTDTHTDKTVETKFGIFAGADGQASATGSGGASIGAKSANGGAQASASGEVDVDFMRSQTDITQTRDVTHTASNLSTGGNLTIVAKNDLRTVGSNLAAGNDVNLQAANQSFEAAQDIHETTVSQSKTSAGLYLSGSASGEAQGSGQSNGNGQGGNSGSGSGSASGTAEVQAGIRGAHSEASVTTGSTVAQVSSITAGGNINRNATGTITDVGTSIGAGGDLNQTATTYNALAAQNTTYTRSSAESDVAKVGISAQASGSAQGSGGQSPQNQSAQAGQAMGDAKGATSGDPLATAGALGNAASMAGGGAGPNGGTGSASVGVAASFSQTKSDSTTGTSTAVVTNIRTGGNANLTSKDKTTLVGTNIASGGDTNLTAGSLDFQAAQNTQTANSSGSSLDVSGRVGIVGSASLDLNAAVGQNSSTANASQAVVGSINSGGNLNVTTTQGDLRLEGTNVGAAGDTTLDSAGAVKFDAAHDTSSSSDSSLSVAAGISASKGKGGSSGGAVQANVDVANAHTSEDNAVTGALNTGGALTVKSATDTTFTGTALTVGGDASVAAGGNVNFNAATSTQHSDSLDVGVGIGASKTGGGKNAAGKEQQGESGQSLSANVGIGKADATEQTASSLTTGGGFTIASGADVNLQGTTIAAQGAGAINAAGNVNATTIADTASALNVGVGIAVDRATTNKATKDANGNAIGKSAQQKNSDKIASKASAKTAKGADAAMAANADAASANSASNLIAAAPDQTQGAPDNAALDKIVADNAAKKAAADKKAADAASPEGKAQAAATAAATKKAKQVMADRKAKAAVEAAKPPEQKAAEAKAKDDAKRAKMTPDQLAADDKKKADAQTKADKKAASDQAKADKKAAAAAAKTPEGKAAAAKAKDDAKRAKMTPDQLAADDKKKADAQAKTDKKAADAQAKADKKAADTQAKADKKAASDQAKADKKAVSDKAAADKKAASDAKKADAAQAKADKKAADQAAKEAKMTPEQKAKSDATKKAAADKKAASDAKAATAAQAKADKKAASDKAAAAKADASAKAKADKKAKADEQESKTTVGITQSQFSDTNQTVTKAGSISGSGIVINAGGKSNLSGTTVSQTPAGAPDPAAAAAPAAPVGASLKALSKTSSVSNAQAKKAITDKKAADAKKASDKAADQAMDKTAAAKAAAAAAPPP